MTPIQYQGRILSGRIDQLERDVELLKVLIAGQADILDRIAGHLFPPQPDESGSAGITPADGEGGE